MSVAEILESGISAHAGNDPSRDSVLRRKAEALALSVWNDHARMVYPSPEALAVLTDCALKGMCVGMIAGHSLLSDSDRHPEGDEGAKTGSVGEGLSA